MMTKNKSPLEPWLLLRKPTRVVFQSYIHTYSMIIFVKLGPLE